MNNPNQNQGNASAPKPDPKAAHPMSGGGLSGSAPGGDPRNADLKPGSVPEDAKGHNPGSMVTGQIMRNR